MNERTAFSLAGIPAALILIAAWLATGAWLFEIVRTTMDPIVAAPAAIAIPVLAFLSKGFLQVQPNQGQVVQLFGRYAGTVREEGLRWTNPFYAKRAVSLRMRNFESGKLKVNDSDGNPIEIAAVVVWQVVDTAEAVFCVLTNRLSGGTADRMLDELPPDVRDLLSICPRRQSSAHASHTDKDDFYLSVAEHLLVDPEDVRRIIHAVFGALHTQIVEREAERIASELPDDIKQTWIAARHAVPAPH